MRPQGETLRLLARDVAVRDERREAGDPYLPAVRVTGEDEVGALRREGVEDAAVRGMGEGEDDGGAGGVRCRRCARGRLSERNESAL